MRLRERIAQWWGRRRTKPAKGYPQVVSRVSRDADYNVMLERMQRDFGVLPANFPFSLYAILDTVSVTDPYISKFVHDTVALGNPGHKLYVQADSEAKANEAIAVCNELAARCFPLGGGMDGVLSGLFHQLARTGACCIEWVPDVTFTQIEQAFLIPVKTLRFRYADTDGSLELLQEQSGKLVPLNMVQTSYHVLVSRDSNPYPIPPIVSALEACMNHRTIMGQIKAWMQKVSSLGVLLATVTSPPRNPGETQERYNARAQQYLDSIADTIAKNLNDGLGIAFDNISFNFQQTQAGAQGAKDVLQLVLQGMFAALQRDPIFFGWQFHSTETFARVIYQEMLQSLKIYQLGVKRAVEHGHRLNLALNGLGDVSISIRFKQDDSVDMFKAAEASMMHTNAVVAQLGAEIIDREEARKLLGHEDKNLEAGAYVAAFNRDSNVYDLEQYRRRKWSGLGIPDDSNGAEDEEDRTSGKGASI